MRRLIRLLPVVMLLAGCGDQTGPILGSIETAFSGVPLGVTPSIVATGPDGLPDTLPAGESFVDLPAGSYQLVGTAVWAGSDLFATGDTARIEITDDVPRSAGFTYALASGIVAVTATGIPGGTTMTALMTGPGRFVRTVTGGDTIIGVPAGSYRIAAFPIDSGGHVFAPAASVRALHVPATANPTSVSLDYTLATGRVAVTISGLPAAAAADLRVAGPNGFSTVLGVSDSLFRLAPGVYTLSPQDVNVSGHIFGGTDTTVTVVPALAAVPITVGYTLTTATVMVDMLGLPAGASGHITLAGGGFTTTVFASDTLVGLVPGPYTLTADTVLAGGVEYAPQDLSVALNLAAADTAVAPVTYDTTGAATLNMSVDGFYLTQAVQRPDGSVPLVTGRDAYLRVFIHANELNYSRPQVRARFFHGGIAVDSLDLSATLAVPLAVNEGVKNASWNAPVPASLLVPGLEVEVEIDPDHTIPEADKSDNRLPATGPRPVLVHALPPLSVTMIPVVNGTQQGNLGTANLDDFLSLTRRMYPVGAEQVRLHAAFVSSAPTLEPDNDNDAWNRTLSELRSLRIAEGGTGYYYGVVHADYGSGVAGLGYVPPSPNSAFKAAIGWDHLPSGSEVMAHELGHNFGRFHTPCGGPANPDPNYPHPAGDIGFYGIDLLTTAIKFPSRKDIMSYCNNPWVSDYTWEGILTRRVAEAAGSPAPAQQGLLVWGRVRGDSLMLEPAFEIEAPPTLPTESGPFRVVGIDVGGATAFDLSFTPTPVADLPGPPESHFAFVIPINGATPLDRIGLSGPGRPAAMLRASSGAPSPADVEVTALGNTDLRVRWDASTHPMVLIRDPTTGEVLGFGRGGEAVVKGRTPAVRVVVSDGVRGSSRVRRVPRPQ